MGMFTIDSGYVSQSESTTVGEGEKKSAYASLCSGNVPVQESDSEGRGVSV